MRSFRLVAGLVCAVGFSGSALADFYGAIAYSPQTGATGYSYDYDSDYEAQNVALAECGASDCQVAIAFVNACGAVAQGNGGWGSAWGYTEGEASSLAEQSCAQYGSGCRTIVWACTSDPDY